MKIGDHITAAARKLNAIPRWRVGLYAFLGGVGLTVAAAIFVIGQGLVTPPVEREVVVQTRVVERAVQKTAKRANVTTTRTSTPGLLRIPEGGYLLGYTTTTTTRDLSTEDATSSRNTLTETKQRTQERPVLPSWSVGILVGGQFAGKSALAVPNAPGLVLGVTAGYRVPLDRLGLPPRYGVWVEAWGTTSGAAGGGIRGEF